MATVTYQYSGSGVQGTTTPPTAAQAFNANMLTALVVFADADTTTLITHNWNLSLAQGTNQFPIPTVYHQSYGTATVELKLGVVLTNSVAVSLTKVSTAAGTGVGATICVVLQRPYSAIT